MHPLLIKLIMWPPTPLAKSGDPGFQPILFQAARPLSAGAVRVGAWRPYN